jgi:uncharacterized protein
MTAGRPAPLRPELATFVALYGAGRFFDAHETLEGAWRRSDEPEMVFYQGLIQWAVAHEHLRRGNPVGARRQLDKAWDKLRRAPDGYLGLDLSAVRRVGPGLAAALRAWEEGGPAPPLDPAPIAPLARGGGVRPAP